MSEYERKAIQALSDQLAREIETAMLDFAYCTVEAEMVFGSDVAVIAWEQAQQAIERAAA